MKTIIISVLCSIARFLGKIDSSKIGQLYQNLKARCYAAYLEAKFKESKNLQTFGNNIHVLGGKYITLGENVIIGFEARLDAVFHWATPEQDFTPEITIGNNVVIAPLCHISCISKIEIGDYTTMGPGTLITDHTHGDTSYEQLSLPPRHRPLISKGNVKIGKNVHLGERVTILPGVTIGDNCIIGANAVVTKDVPPYSIVVGTAGKIVKQVTSENKA